MYPGQEFSPVTEITTDISATDTTIPVKNTSALPPAPNFATLSDGVHHETITYHTISDGILGEVERGKEGEVRSWATGTQISRLYTNSDHQAFINNIEQLDDEKANRDEMPNQGITRFNYTPDPIIWDEWQGPINEFYPFPSGLSAIDLRGNVSTLHEGIIYFVDTRSNPSRLFGFDISVNEFIWLGNCPTANMAGVRMAVYSGDVYFLGCNTAPQNRFWRFNISARQWTQLASHPLARAENASLAFIGKKLYVAGTAITPNSANVYDTDSDTWMTIVAPGVAIATNGSGIAYNDHFYIFHEQTAGHTRRYDPATDTWDGLASSPVTNIGSRAMLVGDNVFMVGATNGFRRYNIPSDTWTVLPNLVSPASTMNQGWAVSDSKRHLYMLFSGNSATLGTHGIFAYDTENPALGWELVSNITHATATGTPAVACDNSNRMLYFAVGNTSTTRIAAYSLDDKRWIPGRGLNVADHFQWASTLTYKDEVYFLGSSAAVHNQRFRKYNPKTTEWTQLPDLPWTMNMTALVWLGEDEFCALGGASTHFGVAKYSFEHGQWEALPNLPFAGTHVAATKIGNRLYAMQQTQAWFLDMETMQWQRDNHNAYARQDGSLHLPARAIAGSVSGTVQTTGNSSFGSSLTLSANNALVNPVITESLTNTAESIYYDNCIIASSSSSGNRLMWYDPESRRYFTTNALPVALGDARLFMVDDDIYLTAPSGNQGGIYKLNQGEMFRPGERVVLGEVIQGQTIYYETRNNNDLYLEIDGVRIPPGKSTAPESGYLTVGHERFVRNNYIRGWIK